MKNCFSAVPSQAMRDVVVPVDAFNEPIHRMAIPDGEKEAILRMDVALFRCVNPNVSIRDIPTVILVRALFGESLVEAYARFGCAGGMEKQLFM